MAVFEGTDVRGHVRGGRVTECDGVDGRVRMMDRCSTVISHAASCSEP